MWPIVGIAAKWIAREIVFSVAWHYGSKYAKKKMAEHKQKVEDAETTDGLVEETKPGQGESGENERRGSPDDQGGDGAAKD